MRVANSGNNNVQGNEAPNAKSAGKAGAAREVKKTEHGAGAEVAKADARGSAHTQISAKGKEHAQAKAVASGAPDVREDRIAELKKKIQEGSYHVDADAVADRMVGDHLRMNGMS